MIPSEIYVYNHEMKIIGLIDCAESVIWTSRYYECGDFEIYTHASKSLYNLCSRGMFLAHKGSEMVGLIEEYKITTDLDGIDHLIISGRCATGLLARRIVITTVPVAQEKAFYTMTELIEQNVVSPSSSFRKIDILGIDYGPVFELTKTHKGGIYTGMSVYKAVTDICKSVDYGIKTIIRNGKLEVVFYEGVYRHKKSKKNTPVIFSPAYDNLAESEHIVSRTNFANSGFLMTGATDNKTIYSYWDDETGLDRYEMFVNATDIPSQSKMGVSNSTYSSVLSSRFDEEMAKHDIDQVFDGKAGFSETFEYKVDYNLGDVVTVENNYGASMSARIVEIIESYDSDGYSMTPFFKSEYKIPVDV